MAFRFDETEAEYLKRLADQKRLAELQEGANKIAQPKLQPLNIPDQRQAALLRTQAANKKNLGKIDKWILDAADEIDRIANMTDDTARELAQKNYLKAVEAKLGSVTNKVGVEATTAVAEQQRLQLGLNLANRIGSSKAAQALSKIAEAYSSFSKLGGGLGGKVLGEFWVLETLYTSGKALITGTPDQQSLGARIGQLAKQNALQSINILTDKDKDGNSFTQPVVIDKRPNTTVISQKTIPKAGIEKQLDSFPKNTTSNQAPVASIKHNPVNPYRVSNAPTVSISNAPVPAPKQQLSVPPSRLQANPVQKINYNSQQSSTRTAPKKVQQINNNIDGVKYGRLLHNPITSTPAIIPIANNQKHQKEWVEQQKELAKTGITQLNWDEAVQGKPYAEAHPKSSLDNLGVSFITNPATHQPLIVWGGSGIADFYDQMNKRAEHNTIHSVKTQVATAAAFVPLTIVGIAATRAAFKGGSGGVGSVHPTTRFSPSPGTGSISTRVKNIRDSLFTSRLLDLLALALNIHNGMMLSSNLVQSLMQVMDDVLSLTGFNKINGKEIDFSDMVASGINHLFVSIVGLQTAKKLKLQWMRLSTAWSSAGVVISSLQSIQYATQAVIEVVGAGMGKIGNGLKSAGVVSEDAYEWLSEQLDARSVKYQKYFDKIENMNELADNIQTVSGSARTVRDSAVEIPKQVDELKKNLKDGAKPIAQKDLDSTKISDPLAIDGSDEIKPGN